jgi:hypothetical protein
MEFLARSQSRDRLELSQMKLEEQEAIRRLENARLVK